MKHQTFIILSIFSSLLLFYSCSQKNEAVREISAFLHGADLSYVNMMEDCGADYKEDGQSKDIYKIFSDNGCDVVRLRLWHTPDFQDTIPQPEGVKPRYHDLNDVEESIRRSHETNMQVMLDIHYSDIWADPSRQALPRAWYEVRNNNDALADSVYNYTYKVLSVLHSKNLTPEMVQIGNEINPGILIHEKVESDFTAGQLLENDIHRQVLLLNHGIDAVRDFEKESGKEIKIIIHVAGYDKAKGFFKWHFDNGLKDFDIIGLSYYYGWHGGSIEGLGKIITELKATYTGYEVMVVETGYPWDSENIDQHNNIIAEPDPAYLPVSPTNQLKYLKDLSVSIKNNGGLGVLFWEPAWVSTPCKTPWGEGSAHEHVSYFDHRNGLNLMKEGGGSWMR